MTAWWERPLLAFDTETTGVQVETARIVTACVAEILPGCYPGVQTWLADPGVEIPAQAAEVHGVTTGHAREFGRPAKEVIVEVAAQISRAWATGAPVVAFNAAYDLTVLDRELRRHCDDRGLALLTPDGEPGPVIDPLVLDRWADPYRKGSRKLADMCAHYGVRQDGAHSADGDALAAARLAWAMGRRFKGIADQSLEWLQELQREAHARWATSFRAYLEQRGRTDDLPDGAWPVRPYVAEAMPR